MASVAAFLHAKTRVSREPSADDFPDKLHLHQQRVIAFRLRERAVVLTVTSIKAKTG